MVIYVVSLYTQCLRYNICSTWFLDIRISTCYICGLLMALNIFSIYAPHASSIYPPLL